jgi:hypothetical protein
MVLTGFLFSFFAALFHLFFFLVIAPAAVLQQLTWENPPTLFTIQPLVLLISEYLPLSDSFVLQHVDPAFKATITANNRWLHSAARHVWTHVNHTCKHLQQQASKQAPIELLACLRRRINQ